MSSKTPNSGGSGERPSPGGDAPKLRIFISWAGKQAERIAEGFREFLPDVVNATELFWSGDDIDKGTRWREVLVSGLQISPCAIVCMTPESFKSIWVAFEAGAISRAAGDPDDAKRRIWPYLQGVSLRELQLSPFNLYQGTSDSMDETFRLIESINKLSPDVVPAESLRRKFDHVFWPNFSKVLEQEKSVSVDQKGAARTNISDESDVLSEILRTVRSIQEGLSRHELEAMLLGESLHVRPPGAKGIFSQGHVMPLSKVSETGLPKVAPPELKTKT